MYSNPDHIEFLNDPMLRESELIYDGSILQLYRNQVELEDGNLAFRELINHQRAVGILAVSPQNTVFLVKQYRFALADYFIEIAAGLRDFIDGEEEDALEAAKRELEEEIAYKANKWQELGSFYVSPGFLNEEITVFIASELEYIENPKAQDDDEHIEVLEYNKDEIRSLMAEGKIKDMKTQLALCYWLNQEDDKHV